MIFHLPRETALSPGRPLGPGWAGLSVALLRQLRLPLTLGLSGPRGGQHTLSHLGPGPSLTRPATNEHIVTAILDLCETNSMQ